MCRILIFGGTTEGRELAEFCGKNNISVYLSVATDYGAEVVRKFRCVHILKGRLNSGDIMDLIIKNGIDNVFDATHPYAVEATRNIKTACEKTFVNYLRIKRDEYDIVPAGKYFDDINALADYLKGKSGKILVTTGSKDLKVFLEIENYRERCVVRVLPLEGVVSECQELGFLSENIAAEKGPFSVEQNLNLLEKFNIKYLVTKESGTAGGFEAKVLAAEKYGAELLIVRRPIENGITVEEAEKIIHTEV